MKTIKYILLSLICALTACTSAQNKEELKKQISEGAYLVDVRTPEEYAAGHVEASVNIPVDEIGANLDKFRGKKHIIVFCHSGKRAQKAKTILDENGIKNVTNGGTWEDIDKLLKDEKNKKASR